MNCPKCNKPTHFVCDNKECACWARIPNDELPMINRYQFWRIPISYWLFRILWDIGLSKYLIELEQCPYCGYSNTMHNWFDMEMEEPYRSGKLE